MKSQTFAKFGLIAVLALPSLRAFAGPPILLDPQTGKYLGNLGSNQYDPNCICNPYGHYGNPYSPDSINNPYGPYGNPYSPDSVRNPYSSSDHNSGDASPFASGFMQGYGLMQEMKDNRVMDRDGARARRQQRQIQQGLNKLEQFKARHRARSKETESEQRSKSLSIKTRLARARRHGIGSLIRTGIQVFGFKPATFFVSHIKEKEKHTAAFDGYFDTNGLQGVTWFFHIKKHSGWKVKFSNREYVELKDIPVGAWAIIDTGKNKATWIKSPQPSMTINRTCIAEVGIKIAQKSPGCLFKKAKSKKLDLNSKTIPVTAKDRP